MRYLDSLAAQVVAADPTPGAPSGGGSIVEPNPPSWLNSAAVVGFLVFVFGLLIIVMAVRMMAKSNKGDVKGAASQSAVAGIATVWVIIGVAGMAFTMVGGLLTWWIQSGGSQ